MRFILVPKFDEASDVLSEADDRLDPEHRLQVYQELEKMRNDPGFRQAGTPSEFENFEAVASEIAGNEIRVVASPDRITVATGVTVIETDDAGALALSAELKQTEIIPDDTLSLVEPDVLATGNISDASQLTDEHLWHLKAVGLERARSHGFTGSGSGVNVAVMDTGIADVSEVRGKIRQTVTLDIDAWKANRHAVMEDTYKRDGHGTLVAGLIAGDRVGIAPGATLDSVILLPGGRSQLSNYILALEWAAADPNIQIINMSAGKSGYHENMRLITRVLQRIRTVAFMAIGNEGPDTSRSPGNYPEVISVGASNIEQNVWVRSGGGEIIVDNMSVEVPTLVAPGEAITTCVKEGGYKAANGTSLATPILSGIACLMLERYPGISLSQLEQELLSACEDLGLDAQRQGNGEANLPHSLL